MKKDIVDNIKTFVWAITIIVTMSGGFFALKSDIFKLKIDMAEAKPITIKNEKDIIRIETKLENMEQGIYTINDNVKDIRQRQEKVYEDLLKAIRSSK